MSQVLPEKMSCKTPPNRDSIDRQRRSMNRARQAPNRLADYHRVCTRDLDPVGSRILHQVLRVRRRLSHEPGRGLCHPADDELPAREHWLFVPVGLGRPQWDVPRY